MIHSIEIVEINDKTGERKVILSQTIKQAVVDDSILSTITETELKELIANWPLATKEDK